MVMLKECSLFLRKKSHNKIQQLQLKEYEKEIYNAKDGEMRQKSI